MAAATLGMQTGTPRMFPSLTIFRAGGLPAPIGLKHCCVTIVTINGRSGAEIGADTLAMLYGDLSPTIDVHVTTVDSAVSTEVAEFFGTAPLPDASGDSTSTVRRPDLATLFGAATHYSRIYPATGNGPPIWERPVVAPGGANAQYYAVGPVGRKILASVGVRIR
jgi:hypothetical protein